MRYKPSNMQSNLFLVWYSLHQTPSKKMGLAGELKSMVGVADLEFSKMFPSVLAVLDYWSISQEDTLFVPNLPRLPAFTQSYRFQERGLSAELPLRGGELLMKIHSSYPDTVRDPNFLEEIDFDIEWGQPRVEGEFIYRKRPEAPCRDTNRLFWEEQVPTFDF
jgi:hypothetical protein